MLTKKGRPISNCLEHFEMIYGVHNSLNRRDYLVVKSFCIEIHMIRKVIKEYSDTRKVLTRPAGN